MDAFMVQGRVKSSTSRGGGYKGHGGYGKRGGCGGYMEPSICYNYRELGHIARNCTKPRSSSGHYHNPEHKTEDCPKLIKKWEEKRRRVNMVTIEQRKHEEVSAPTINIVTKGGTWAGTDAKAILASKIQKPDPRLPKFHLIKQKQYLHKEIETLENAQRFNEPMITDVNDMHQKRTRDVDQEQQVIFSNVVLN
jgi:hypothetical protein